VAATFVPRWRRALSVDRGAALVIRWSIVALLLLNWFYELKLR
jgi:hypothetical protein